MNRIAQICLILVGTCAVKTQSPGKDATRHSRVPAAGVATQATEHGAQWLGALAQEARCRQGMLRCGREKASESAGRVRRGRERRALRRGGHRAALSEMARPAEAKQPPRAQRGEVSGSKHASKECQLWR